MGPRLDPDSSSSCLNLSSAGITGPDHNPWLGTLDQEGQLVMRGPSVVSDMNATVLQSFILSSKLCDLGKLCNLSEL